MRHYSYRTEQTYAAWIRRYLQFHDNCNPAELGSSEIEAFLTDLAVQQQVSASTQGQTLSALLFLYQRVLSIDLPWLDNIVRARRPRRLPVVLSRVEVSRVLDQLHPPYWLIASPLYGSGLRIMEALRLRVKDVGLEQRKLLVRDGKGAKDRVTVLPDRLIAPLSMQLRHVEKAHDHAQRHGFAGVELPYALSRKYPTAHLELAWQYVFPAPKPSRDARSGAWRRHHMSENTVQRNVRQAVRAAGIRQPPSCHTFRH